jgi:hypothetical protein
VGGDTWRWEGERARCTAVFGEGCQTQTARDERLDEHGNWVTSMDVSPTNVESRAIRAGPARNAQD